MGRVSSEKLKVEEAKLRFRQSMNEATIRNVVKNHPLISTAALFAAGFLLRRSASISAPLGILNLATTVIRKL